MHDIRWIRQNAEAFDAEMARRGLPAQSSAILTLDAFRRDAILKVEAAQKARNERAKAIGMAKGRGDTAEV